MTNNPTIDGVSRELLRKQFEEENAHRGWFVAGGTSESDTPEGFVYGDFTTDMCWTCYFQVADSLQSTIAQLQARVQELESGPGEPVAYVCPEWLSNGEHATHARRSPTETHSVALYAGSVSVDKYDEVLLPFLAMMRNELHANAGKGDRPGWLSMTPSECLLEIYYHLGKLQKGVKDGNELWITEYSADVANMAMMLADICGRLDATAALNGVRK